MTGRERLQKVQERLVAAGVRDVKFTPAGGWLAHFDMSPGPNGGITFTPKPKTDADVDKMCNDLAVLLEAHLDGKTTLISAHSPDGFTVKCEDRFEVLKTLPDGTRLSLHRMLFTTGLLVGVSEDGLYYERRYCYPDWGAASAALTLWDGAGDPPGPWIKEKPGDRLGPGALED